MGKESEELDQKLIEVLSDSDLVAGNALGVAKAETSSDRVVNVEHVGHSAPGVRVVHARGRARVSAHVEGADGAMDFKEAEHRGGARSALEPQYQRGTLGSHLLRESVASLNVYVVPKQ